MMKALDPQTEGSLPPLRYHLSTTSVFCGTTGKIQNDLIDAVAEAMGEQITMEVKKSAHVSLLAGETTDGSNAAQLPLVLCPVMETQVTRFIRLEDVTSGSEPMALLLFLSAF